MIEFSFLVSFTKSVKRLKKKYRSLEGDIDQLLEELQANPYLGTDLGGNVRKIRLSISSKNKGKRGGARVLTDTEAVVSIDEGRVTLLALYDKSERETLTDAEIKELVHLSRYYKKSIPLYIMEPSHRGGYFYLYPCLNK